MSFSALERLSLLAAIATHPGHVIYSFRCYAVLRATVGRWQLRCLVGIDGEPENMLGQTNAPA